MEERKELKVSAIENGTVIDHIPTQSVFQVISILKLQECDNQILFGTNLESQKYGKKGNYVVGANIAGFVKVANAMMAQGIW